ncbi:MAG: ubiquinol-cytochrome c reductase iron-sulfur subunit [Pseudomonadota bacterium]|jgi:ubiquinol-cytochrome c reductase iron-sulfur subunit
MKDNDTPTDAPTLSPPVTRRDFIHVASGAMLATGAALAVWPLVDSLNPSADVLAMSSVEVDLTPVAVGQRITVKWRGRPVFISRRTPREIALARADDNNPALIDPARDASRAERAEWLVVIGVCTHLGCVPLGQAPSQPRSEYGGWFCPCHGSKYDTAGRVRRGPAPRNLDLPPYVFLDDRRLKIGHVSMTTAA